MFKNILVAGLLAIAPVSAMAYELQNFPGLACGPMEGDGGAVDYFTNNGYTLARTVEVLPDGTEQTTFIFVKDSGDFVIVAEAPVETFGENVACISATGTNLLPDELIDGLDF